MSQKASPGEAAEHERYHALVQSWQLLQVKIHDGLYFQLRSRTDAHYICTLVLSADKRVVSLSTCGPEHTASHFYAAEITHGGIVGAVFLHAKEVLEIVKHPRCNILYRNVVGLVVEFEEVFQIVNATSPALIGGLHDVTTVKFLLAFLVCLAEHFAPSSWASPCSHVMRLGRPDLPACSHG